MPLLEAPETTESAEPSGTAGAITPGTGTLAGASIASLGTEVPSGSEPTLLLLLAVALALIRLAVHTPESSASGTSVIALARRDIALVLVISVLSPGSFTLPRPPDLYRHVLNECSLWRSRANTGCDRRHTCRVRPRG